MPDYGSSPFRNGQAAKADRKGTAYTVTNEDKYNMAKEQAHAVPSTSPTFSQAERDSQLSKYHKAMKSFDPKRFERELKAKSL